MPIRIATEPTLTKGKFEYIEAKIRRDAEGTTFGGDFEWLCKWFLENAPRYRGQFEEVWLWKDWPDRWGADAGIDIVARTRLFMTATPRYFKEHVKRRAAELESEFFQLVSMDDVHVFGPEFHVLTFHEAISANPPLLTDYQVVVIGVTAGWPSLLQAGCAAQETQGIYRIRE